MKLLRLIGIIFVLLAGSAGNLIAQTAVPQLSVNVDAGRHRISPYIYGINYYAADETVFDTVPITLQREGGNNTSNYNWLVDSSNSGSDFFFIGGSGTPESQVTPGQSIDAMISFDKTHGAASLITIPITGYVNRYSDWNCSYPQNLYPNQGLQWGAFEFWPYVTDMDGYLCGSGLTPDNSGNQLTDTDILLNYSLADPAWMRSWITHMIHETGRSRPGNRRFYEMDNEPESWNYVHHDVHPDGTGFDELVGYTEAFAAMIKETDPQSKVTGPVNCCTWAYYDMGSSTDNQTTHNGTPWFQYYLQSMKKYEDEHHIRLLDYLDFHFYPSVDGVSIANSTAGDATTQAARLRSTRALWDSTYVAEDWTGQYFPTTFGTPNLIPNFRSWVKAYYPGTKTAITEYNWGGLEDINGALAQADVLGIFGRERLDLATLWGPPTAGQPGTFAFQIYLNFDGKGGKYGDVWVDSRSTDQSQLAIYGAQRKHDHALTLLVINKTGNDLSSRVALQGFQPDNHSADVYQYSGANLGAIVQLAAASIQKLNDGDKDDVGKPSRAINYTFPANSITLFVLTGQSKCEDWDGEPTSADGWGE